MTATFQGNDATEFQSLFEPKQSTTGSNKYVIKCKILTSWNDILIDLEQGKLHLLLQFVKGLESPQAMGFDPPCKLLFEQANCLRSMTLYANTCSNKLTLPALADYNLF